jgi:hypothetical protein
MASSLLAVRREYLGCCMMSHAVNNSIVWCCHEEGVSQCHSFVFYAGLRFFRLCAFWPLFI